MSELDDAYLRAQSGDAVGFENWVRRVELPLRMSLRSFARQVDTEAIIQEGLLRMWVLAPTLALEGENASLRYALRVVYNLALHEAKRLQRFVPLDLEGTGVPSELTVEPEPPIDPGLRKAISDCISRLSKQARNALLARLHGGLEPDRALADRLSMRLNTFLQNVIRARQHVAQCLESRGISVRELLR
jgi:DNA-directed RNA polymerase specialized sigma24 family protein